MNTTWQPTITLENLRTRAAILDRIRHFFKARQVLEVETPLLSNSTVTDPYIQSFSTAYQNETAQFEKTLYLQTSPEFAMKRLLAMGAGPIYQITHAFRNQGEKGRWHNPEFTLLEWYRPGFTLHDLMDETDILLQTILQTPPAQRISYATFFQQQLRIDPHTVTREVLIEQATQLGIAPQATEWNRDDWLQLLLDHLIQRHATHQTPLFIYDFPASQAALARIRPDNPPVAERVEVYVNGLELANGFYELTDSQEQKKRFLRDLNDRKQGGLPTTPIDHNFLEALSHGLPPCSGIALGIDRLVALATQAEQLSEVISFPIERA